MGIKNDEFGTCTVSFSKRNPKTGMPVSRTRVKVQKSKAKAVERQLIAKVEQKIHQKTIPTWENLMGGYLKNCEGRDLTSKTVYNTEKCLTSATLPEWSGRLVDQITTDEIRTLISVKFGDKSPSHRKTILKLIRGAFNFALESDFVNRNPVPQMKFKVGDKIKSVLTEDQARTLLTKAKELDWPWYPHYAMALYTGMRNGELFALTWDKVNLAERKMLVDCAWNNVDGFKSTKSGDDRIVEIAPNLLLVLEELKLRSGGEEFVLPRMEKWHKGEQARELRMFMIGIGLQPVSFHNLRSTWATLMLSKGVEPVKVMTMGGWKDMKTMMIYIRKAGIDIRGITHKLELHDPRKTSGKVLNFDRGSSV